MPGSHDGHGASLVPALVGSSSVAGTGSGHKYAGSGSGLIPALRGAGGFCFAGLPVGRSGPLPRDRSPRHNRALGRARS